MSSICVLGFDVVFSYFVVSVIHIFTLRHFPPILLRRTQPTEIYRSNSKTLFFRVLIKLLSLIIPMSHFLATRFCFTRSASIVFGTTERIIIFLAFVSRRSFRSEIFGLSNFGTFSRPFMLTVPVVASVVTCKLIRGDFTSLLTFVFDVHSLLHQFGASSSIHAPRQVLYVFY